MHTLSKEAKMFATFRSALARARRHVDLYFAALVDQVRFRRQR
jgi:hypothetical protein